MKTLTEQQRKNIIDFINAVKSSFAGVEPSDSHEFDLEELTPLVFDAALASLTAVPEVSEIKSVHPENGNTIIHLRRGGLRDISPEDISECEMDETEWFYPAPPVPVIKFPDLIKNNKVNESDEYYLGIQSGWKECLEETKRFNGLEDSK